MIGDPAHVDLLQKELQQLQASLDACRNELSIVSSLQRCFFDLEQRLAALERKYITIANLPKTTEEPSAGHFRHRANTVEESLGRRTEDYVRFGDIYSLVKAIEGRFYCRNGYRGEFACEPGEHVPVAIELYRYRVLGAIASAGIPNAQKFLRIALWDTLARISRLTVKGKHALYWRHDSPHIEESYDPETERYKISMRVAIPSADWSLTDLVKEDNAPYKVFTS